MSFSFYCQAYVLNNQWIVHISVGLACQPNEYEAIVTRYYTSAASEESFAIYNGADESGDLMLSKQGTSADDFHTYTYPICISRGNPYYITLYDSGYNCWSAGSYIQITVGEITIYHSRLSINISDEDIFSFPLCMSDEVEAVITRHYTTGADEESFAIYQDSLTTGDLMIMSYGSELDTSKTYKYPLCMLKGYSYFMAFYDTGNNG